MPNESLEDALKEVYALAPNDVVTLDTLEISYVGLTETLYLVKDRVSWDLTLEGTGGTKTFKPCGFRFIQPAAGKEGIQQLTLAVDNVGEEVSDFFNTLGTELTEPVKVIYRPYLSNDTTQPQMNPPLELFLVDINMTVFEVTGRATFTSVVNTKYPTQYYSAQRFPGLVGRGGNVVDPPPSGNAWDVNNLSFSASLDITTEVPTNHNSNDLYVSPDGLYLFVSFALSGSFGEGGVQTYSFGTAWDITTITPVRYLDVSENIEGVTFKPDGTKMILSLIEGTGGSGVGKLYEYDLSTAWDTSTAVLNQSVTFNARELYLRADGNKLYTQFVGIKSYSFGTAFDISTLTLDGTFSPGGNVTGVYVKPDGDRLFYIDGISGVDVASVRHADYSIVWDITTVSYNGDEYIPSTVQVPINGIHWRDTDGTRCYSLVLNGSNWYVYEFDII